MTAHQELLRIAHEKEERRVREAEELAKTKEKIVQARREAVEAQVEGVAWGMTVQEVVDEEGGEVAEILPAKKIPERKTKKERRKAEKQRAEVQLFSRNSVPSKLLTVCCRNALSQRKWHRNAS